MIDNLAPYLKVNLTIPLADIKAEAEHLKNIGLYAEHRSEDAQGWNVFTLFGQGPFITIGGDWGDKEKYHWTDLAVKHCPKTVKWLQALPYKEIYRVRFMFLEPQGYIKIHNDKEPDEEIGYTQVDHAMNIAISHPQDCYMRMVYKDMCHDVPFEDGSSFFFNNRYFHYVMNESQQTRIHMIIHAKWQPLSVESPELKLQDIGYKDHTDKVYSNNHWNNRMALDEKIQAYSPDLSGYSKKS
jgi:aspartyl/asparaginyl beta-hydroxylase (cupin superfamily)